MTEPCSPIETSSSWLAHRRHYSRVTMHAMGPLLVCDMGLRSACFMLIHNPMSALSLQQPAIVK
jgi:hypothetical protein